MKLVNKSLNLSNSVYNYDNLNSTALNVPSFLAQLTMVPDSIVGDNAGSKTLLWFGKSSL